MVSGTRCPYVSSCGCEVVKRAAAPKGLMTYAVFIWALTLELGPLGWNLGLEAGIWASRLGFEHRGWDLSLDAGIWASRLGFEPRGCTHKKMKIIFVDIRIFGSKVIFFIIIFRLYKCYIWLYRCYTSYTGENGEKNPKLYRLVWLYLNYNKKLYFWSNFSI